MEAQDGINAYRQCVGSVSSYPMFLSAMRRRLDMVERLCGTSDVEAPRHPHSISCSGAGCPLGGVVVVPGPAGRGLLCFVGVSVVIILLLFFFLVGLHPQSSLSFWRGRPRAAVKECHYLLQTTSLGLYLSCHQGLGFSSCARGLFVGATGVCLLGCRSRSHSSLFTAGETAGPTNYCCTPVVDLRTYTLYSSQA